MLRQRHQHPALPQDSRLLPRNQRNRLAQPIHVIERNVGDHREQRLHDVGRIQPPAHAHFQHRQVDPRIGKRLKSHRGERLKKTRMRRQLPLGHQSPRAIVHAKIMPCKTLIADRLSVDPYALVHAHQMRRRIQPASMPGALQNRSQRRRRRPLPVGPRNQNRTKSPLRMPQRLHQRLHLLQPEFSSRLSRRRMQLTHPRMKTVERRRIRHSSILGQFRTPGIGPGSRLWPASNPPRPAHCFPAVTSTLR
jgi:hypothetical protein